ncbi:PQQ-binding-like beta-propeller repeat protein [Candidatus Poribacteria bacterium]|nr:PQQ-binding-like beta-propeller repeat protein [Candidatus Poribacteria bacterium]
MMIYFFCFTAIIALFAYNGSADMDNSGSEWPMDRHDPQMTGHTELKGKMAETPKLLQRHYLGMWANHLVVNYSDDKNEEVSIPEEIFGNGYLSRTSIEWGLSQPSVDIDGKGSMTNKTNQSAVRLAKLLPDIPGYQKVEFDNAFSIGAEENYGRMYAYDKGADNPRLVWQTERIKDMYSPVVAIADTDLDGQDEVILLTHYHLAIYDALTGKEKESVSWNVGRNYGQLDVVDVNSDGRPDFVIQADDPPHLEYIANKPSGLEMVWSHKYLKDEGDVAVPREFYLQNLPNTVRDLDGDGKIEFAVNIHDFREEGRWRVVVFDVITGEVKYEIQDRYLWAVADLDSDGCFDFFMSEALDKTIDRRSRLFVSTLKDNQVIQRWESDDKGRFCMRPYFFPDNVNSASSRGPVTRSVLVTNGYGDVEGFFVSVGKKLLPVDGKEYKTKFTVTSPSKTPPKALAASSDLGILVEVNAESGNIGLENSAAKIKSHYQKGNFRATPAVADVDGDGKNEIIVEDAEAFIRVMRLEDNNFETLWKFRASAQPVWVTWKTDHAPVSVVDLDGDGKKEIICCDNGDEEHTTIYALRHEGSVYWKSEFDWIAPGLTETFRVGLFRKEGWDVLVTIQANTQPEMLCLDGRTGDIRWHRKIWRDDTGKAWPYPNNYVCFDNNGDGYHEIYGSYAYIYYALDGNTGKPFQKPVNIWSDVFKRWQSYSTPIPADFDGDGNTEFLLASFSFAIGGIAIMTPECDILWEKALSNDFGARGLQGVGDCDGDGIPDIAFYHLDGRIACYDGKTGQVKWEVKDLKSHGSMSGGHFASGDIDSDGYDEFLYPLGSNELIALDHHADNHVLWRVVLSADPGTPILADVDGDGLAEILVCTSDGFLNVLD